MASEASVRERQGGPGAEPQPPLPPELPVLALWEPQKDPLRAGQGAPHGDAPQGRGRGGGLHPSPDGVQ